MDANFGVKYGGFVEEKIDKYGFGIIAVFGIIINLIPLAVAIYYAWRISPTLDLLLLLIIWYMWLFFSIRGMYFDKSAENEIEIIHLFIYLPAVIPTLFAMRMIIYVLKQFYPNSDDPNEILKFERKQKIKTFL